MKLCYRPALMAGTFALLLSGCGGGSVSAPRATPTSPSSAPFPAGPLTWRVTAGSQDVSEAFQALPFYPSAITIDAGDSVKWTFPAGEPHTVSFPVAGQSPVAPSDPSAMAPAGGTSYDGTVYASSGFLVDGATYTLTFPKPGVYTYYSLTQQPVAVGKVTVHAAGSPYPESQTAYDATAQSSITSDLAAAQGAPSLFPFAPGGVHLSAGIAPGLAAGPPSNSTVMRFLSAPSDTTGTVNVAVGTTVVWTNEANNVPHNVYFPPVGQTPPPGPPGIPAAGGSVYDGTTEVNSAVMAPGDSYSLTFTKAGTFKYYCLFHDDEGMIGTVIVH